MKYIRLVSDLHLDFDIRAFNKTRLENPNIEGEMAFLWMPPIMDGDNETTLVIAGDLWDDRKFLRRKFSDGESWLKKVSKQFKYIVFVLGNHDYWGTNLTIETDLINKELLVQGIVNTYLLETNLVILDNVKFIGGTLWTNYDRLNPLKMIYAPMIMRNDHSSIRVGNNYRKAHVEDFVKKFDQTKNVIFDNCKKDNDNQKVIVVTHMAPSFRSIHSQWKDASTNAYYYSDLDVELCYQDHDIMYWFHGHTHSFMDYVLEESRTEKTRVICNPRGYGGSEKTEFNPEFRLELLEL